MRALVLPLAVALVLAGCADEGGQKDDFEDVFDDTDVATGKGLIRGVVLDPALVPVVDATVSLSDGSQTKQTSEHGAFVFADLEPGTYFLQVSKFGWTSVQQSAEVRADVAEPAVLKVVIERIPGIEPRAVTLEQDGFISCSIGTPTHFIDCNTTTPQRSRVFFPIEGMPTAIQSEIIWESTQPVGDWFYVIQGICECDGDPPSLSEPRYDEVADARSPYVVRVPGDWLEDEGAGTDYFEFAIDVSASGPEPDTTFGTGAAVNQEFHTYVTFFYNFDPDEQWTFGESGPYPVPGDG